MKSCICSSTQYPIFFRPFSGALSKVAKTRSTDVKRMEVAMFPSTTDAGVKNAGQHLRIFSREHCYSDKVSQILYKNSKDFSLKENNLKNSFSTINKKFLKNNIHSLFLDNNSDMKTNKNVCIIFLDERNFFQYGFQTD